MSAFSCACNDRFVHLSLTDMCGIDKHDQVCSVISLCFWREELDSVIWFKDITSLCFCFFLYLLEGSVLTHRLFQIKITFTFEK